MSDRGARQLCDCEGGIAAKMLPFARSKP